MCDDEDEVVHVKAQQVPLLGGDDNGETFDQNQVTLAERSNGPSLATTTNLLSSFLIFVSSHLFFNNSCC